jgi:hypothetical protein
VTVDVQSGATELTLAVGIFSARGFEVATWSSKSSDGRLQAKPGINEFRIGLENLNLLPGQYSLGLNVIDDRGGEDYVHEAILFEVVTSPDLIAIDAQDFKGALVASANVSALD